jgi:pimeloyl-ACP methyl ester carboxylesterase
MIALLAACDPEPPTVTPKPTIANALAPSPVINPVLPTQPGYTPFAKDQFTPGFNYTLPPPVATTPSQTLSIPLDDAILKATFYRGNVAKPATVILLHGQNQTSAVWLDVPSRLQKAGFNVLALDWRGYGESSGQADWSRATTDLHNALLYLDSVNLFDSSRVALMGLEGGGTIAITACVAESGCKAVIAISPKTAGKFEPSKVIPTLGKRPLLLLGTESEALKPLRDLAPGEGTLQQFSGAGGADLILNNADASGIIAAWLATRL